MDKDCLEFRNGSVVGNGEHETTNTSEMQYLNEIKHILTNGKFKNDRTEVGTYSVFGSHFRYNLRNGDLGPIYGFQWRHFGATYENANSDYTGQGVDQLMECIHLIKTDPNNRRIIMSAWNPCDIPKMALPPCHCLVQFYVSDGELSCQLYQRSADMGLGVPFNVASYSLLVYMIAHVTGLKPGDFVHTTGDTHVYSTHVDALKEQLTRKPKPFPKLKIKRDVSNIEDFKFDDFELIGYNPYPKISMPMAV